METFTLTTAVPSTLSATPTPASITPLLSLVARRVPSPPSPCGGRPGRHALKHEHGGAFLGRDVSKATAVPRHVRVHGPGVKNDTSPLVAVENAVRAVRFSNPIQVEVFPVAAHDISVPCLHEILLRTGEYEACGGNKTR